MKFLDRVYEAYFGDLGDNLYKSTRERVHWACFNVKGEIILDIGCSQGITSILLAREGRYITGIDLQKESINFANNCLETESDVVKKNLKFICDDFMGYNFGECKFDTIIINEVLEHLVSPLRFLEKANSLLNEDGVVIVTVPFGINRFPDHKRTYYYCELAEQIENFFEILDIKFFVKWIGVVSKKSTKFEKASNINKKILKGIEENFYMIEDDYLSRINLLNDKKNKLEQINKGLKEIKIENEKLLEEKIEQEKQIFNDKIKQEKDRYEKLFSNYLEIKDEYIECLKDFKESIKYQKEQLLEVDEEYKYLIKVKEELNKLKMTKSYRMQSMIWKIRKKLRI